MPGRPKNPAGKQSCYCITCNGAIMSNRTFRRHLNRPQASRNNITADTTRMSGYDDRETRKETSESRESDDSTSSLDLDRPTKRARTGSNIMDLVC
jgi:hypothetical protein